MQYIIAASAALTEKEKGKRKGGFTGTKKCRHERRRGAGIEGSSQSLHVKTSVRSDTQGPNQILQHSCHPLNLLLAPPFFGVVFVA